MKVKAWLFLLLAGWMASVSSAFAANVAAKAIVLAEKLREEAFYAVVNAQDRVRGAQENLQLMLAVEKDVARSGDRAAIQTARQAVNEGELGVREARQLLERAKALLARREEQFTEVAVLGAREKSKPGGLRGAMLALEGEVKVFDASGRAVGNRLRPLQAGDRVVTGKDGRARLILAGGDADALLEPGSDFRITEDSLDAGFEAVLDKGFILVRARVMKFASRFTVRTPSGGGAVRGTEFFMHALPEGMRVGVWEGVVAVTPGEPGATPVELRAGEQRAWTRADGWGALPPLDRTRQHVDWGD